MPKKYYRCNVCNDIHYGNSAPEICPTCKVKNAYVEVDFIQVSNILEMNIADTKQYTKEELKEIWKKFTEKNDFTLNSDLEVVDMIADGVLINEKNNGFMTCPCRLPDGTRKRDLELICPCNFKTHNTWKEKGMCWCSLFVKRTN